MEKRASIRAKMVANNIRQVREFKNYTQLYMAKKLNISQNAYSKIELGYSRLSLEKLFEIASALDINEMALFHIDDCILQLKDDVPWPLAEKKER